MPIFVDLATTDDKLEQTNILDLVKDQIQLLLFTKKGDVMGFPDMGINLESYIHELNFNNSEIRQAVKRQINQYVMYSRYFRIDAIVKLIEGEFSTTGFIDIQIDGISQIGVHIT